MKIADGIEGDWTDIWVVEGPHAVLHSVGLDRLDQRVRDKIDHRFHFRCIDAAYWVIDSVNPDLSAKLAVYGFATELYETSKR